MKRCSLVLCSFWFCAAALATGVRMKHTVTLQPGWNAFFLPITLDEPAEKVFAGWPVDTVGFYDQNAFAKTQQFTTSAEDSTLGAVDGGMKMWKRDGIGFSSFQLVAANGVYVTVNTNRTVFAVDLYGEPSAYRITWHASDGVTAPLNYIGVSSWADAPLLPDGYFSGLDANWTERYKIRGVPTAAAPSLSAMGRDSTMPNGGAIAMDAAKISDWSGVLNVSPVNGIDLGTELSMAAVSVRNDAATNRTVRIRLDPSASDSSGGIGQLELPAVKFLDTVRHAQWQDDLARTSYECELKPGETLRLQLAVNREEARYQTNSGQEYGGVVVVEDVSSLQPSYFRTTIPFSVCSDGGVFARTQWPRGLWSASIRLDKVGRTIDENAPDVEYTDEIKIEQYTTYVEVTNANNEVEYERRTIDKTITNRVPVLTMPPVPVAQPMTVRVLVHVDAEGNLKLLQRARFAGRRLTAAVLPADHPVLSGTGEFGRSASFVWQVGEHSNVNPFRHAKHPDHDGKNADFSGPAPSGDDFDNYLSTVKPELFTIGNTLTFEWNATSAASWAPEETLEGVCTWSLKGLRREGSVDMSGTFRMKRLAASDLTDITEEFNGGNQP
ncbi:MAG: hypothetical protein ACI4QT_01915 [Kiritimatiellia bacterium]